jgi:hypothetical protein
MAYTFSGIGATYYGKRDVSDNGSYITTEFIVILCFPIIPIRSFRVLPIDGNSEWLFGYWSSSVTYLSKQVPLNVIQVINVYLCAFLFIIIFPILAYCMAFISDSLTMLLK